MAPVAFSSRLGLGLLDRAFEKLGLSACALDRILKVARTIADLAGSDAVRALILPRSFSTGAWIGESRHERKGLA